MIMRLMLLENGTVQYSRSNHMMFRYCYMVLVQSRGKYNIQFGDSVVLLLKQSATFLCGFRDGVQECR